MLRSRSAIVSTAAMFGANGLLIGAYAASLPSLRDHLGLSEIELPLILLAAGMFGIIGMQVAGRLVDEHGARRLVVTGLVVLIAGVSLLALAGGFGSAVAAAALLGLGNGAVDVAMNAFGVRVEQAYDTALMSRFHALWSLGNFVGAGVVLLSSLVTPGRPGTQVLLALGGAAGVGVLATVAVARWCPDPPAPPKPPGRNSRRGRIPRLAWLLGAMAVCFGLAEGTAYDWSSIHVTDVTGVDPGLGALGLVVTAAFMVVIRLFGDFLVDRFGRRAVVRFGGLCAATGYLVVSFATTLPPVLAGWALVGLGVGMIAPQVYAVAGHQGGGRGLALVVTFGYATFLAGPAIMGALIVALGVGTAMLVPGVMCLVLAGLSVGMPAKKP